MDLLDQLTLHRRRFYLCATVPKTEFQGEQFRRSVRTGGLGRLGLVRGFDDKLPDSNHMGTYSSHAGRQIVLIQIQGGVSYAWESWRTLVPLIVGLVGLIGFVLYEKYGAREPLIRLSIFQNRTAIVNYLGTIIHGMVLWCLLYYEPLYYEAVKGYSPIIAGVAIFPETFTVAPVSVLTGFLVTLTGRYRWALWSGWVLTTFGLGILYLLDVDTSVVSWVFLNLACGIGMGLLFPSMALPSRRRRPTRISRSQSPCFPSSALSAKPLELRSGERCFKTK